MNQARFQQLIQGQTSLAKKVYEAVPIGEPWLFTQIQSELMRQGTNRETKMVMACLQALEDAGLVVQPSRGVFQRVRVREKVVIKAPGAQEEKIEQKAEEKPVEYITKRTALERLSQLSNRVNEMREALKVLADDIETVAIEVADEIAKKDEEAKALKQLKALLKSLD